MHSSTTLQKEDNNSSAAVCSEQRGSEAARQRKIKLKKRGAVHDSALRLYPRYAESASECWPLASCVAGVVVSSHALRPEAVDT